MTKTAFRLSSCCTLLLPAFLFSVLHVSGQEARIDGILQELEQVHSFSRPSISPDGRWITWNENEPDGRGKIYLADRTATPMEARPVSELARNSAISWAPDSSRFAFLSDAGSAPQQQIFSASTTDTAARRVTNLNGYVTEVRWSPDGKQIAFLYAEHGGGGGPLQAGAAQVGEIGSALHNQRICVISAEGDPGHSDPHELSPADLNVYEYAWSPDGSRFAAIAAPGPADNNWWIAKLYTVGAQSGQMQVIYSPVHQQIAIPRWSPDGKRIAFIGGLMSDQGFVGGDIYVSGSEGGPAKDVTSGDKFSVSSLRWVDNGRLVFTAAKDGGSVISSLSLSSDRPETVWKDSVDLHEAGNDTNLAFADDAKTSIAVRSTWQEPPEIWAGSVGQWREVTHKNDGQQPHWGKAESIVWNSGPYRVQGWLLYPQNYDPAKRYPMIVSVHGGPAGEHSASWPNSHFDMSVMAGLGYFVFFPNPRGSYGEGEAFTRANVKDFGYGDLKDVLAGMDVVLKKAPVDANRIGVAGWSYGGFMTMWTVTQTNRFHAAVAGAGIADWLSYYGENSIDEWMIPYFGASVYDDPAVYAKSSPITFIKHVKTPTLVLVGDRDEECPAPQSFEFWHALKTLGVPTKLVVYPGEGHRFDRPEDNLDRMRRTAAWFDQYLAAETAQR